MRNTPISTNPRSRSAKPVPRSAFLGVAVAALALSGCLQPTTGTATTGTTAIGYATEPTIITTTSSTATNVVKIVTAALATTDSFEPPTSVATPNFYAAKRFFDINGNAYSSTTMPTWFVGAYVYLTKTRTSSPDGSVAASGSKEDTPCAYFDTYGTDNNPGNAGFYAIDGFYTSDSTTSPDIDQCAGATAAEQANLKLYFVIDRSKMNTNDKLNIIVTASPLDAPNTSPTPSGCVVGGMFDASACTNQLFTVTMRAGPTASAPMGAFMPAKPFFMLFPSAKALDLISESIYLPINAAPGISTISIDRVKGGAVFHNITIIRMN